MPLTPLHSSLADLFNQLDMCDIPVPTEFGIGNYVFYPDGKFTDISSHRDFYKLSPSYVQILLNISQDLLHLQNNELFKVFVQDGGILVIDKAQRQVEYSIDIVYSTLSSRLEEVYPQITYPNKIATKESQFPFVRNTVAHEAAHHADYWLDSRSKNKLLYYLHSGSVLFNWLFECDRLLYPNGLANLILHVREEEGYSETSLLKKGYDNTLVQDILRAESFAITCEFYSGNIQEFSHSSLLEIYINQVLTKDIDIRKSLNGQQKNDVGRGALYKAINADIEIILGESRTKFEDFLLKNIDAVKPLLSEVIDEYLRKFH